LAIDFFTSSHDAKQHAKKIRTDFINHTPTYAFILIVFQILYILILSENSSSFSLLTSL